MKRFFHQLFFTVRLKWLRRLAGFFRNGFYRLQGMHIGMGTWLPKVYVTWPNQVFLGRNCKLERNISFKYDGIWSEIPGIIIKNEVFIGSGCEFNISNGIHIGEYTNIASGCKFIDHDHGKVLGSRIGPQPSVSEKIVIGSDVWLGCNVIVLKGVHIEDGAVVAAGAVVTKTIPKNEIWAGVPAKRISERTKYGKQENHSAYF